MALDAGSLHALSNQDEGGPYLEADDVLLASVAARDLDRLVDGLAAAVGEEEAAQGWGHDGHQPVQQAHLRAEIGRPCSARWS